MDEKSIWIHVSWCVVIALAAFIILMFIEVADPLIAGMAQIAVVLGGQ